MSKVIAEGIAGTLIENVQQVEQQDIAQQTVKEQVVAVNDIANQEVDDSMLDTTDTKADDKTDEETSDGKEEKKDGEEVAANFDQRSGDNVNINSTLMARTQADPESVVLIESEDDNRLATTLLNETLYVRADYNDTNNQNKLNHSESNDNSDDNKDDRGDVPTTSVIPGNVEPDPIIGNLSLVVSSAVNEGDKISVTLNIDKAPSTDLLVKLSSGETITIPAGQMSASAMIDNPIHDNAYKDVPRDVTVSIDSTSGGNFDQLNMTNDSGIVAVNDDQDTTTIFLSIPDKLVEGDKIPVTITLSNPVAGDTPLEITLSTGDKIIIPVGESSITANIPNPISDNDIIDGNRALDISITGTNGAGNYEAIDYTDTNAKASTTVIDNQTVQTVTIDPIFVFEGDTIKLVATLDHPSTEDITITLSNFWDHGYYADTTGPENVKWMFDSKYASDNYTFTVTIPAGETEGIIEIDTKPDNGEAHDYCSFEYDIDVVSENGDEFEKPIEVTTGRINMVEPLGIMFTNDSYDAVNNTIDVTVSFSTENGEFTGLVGFEDIRVYFNLWNEDGNQLFVTIPADQHNAILTIPMDYIQGETELKVDYIESDSGVYDRPDALDLVQSGNPLDLTPYLSDDDNAIAGDEPANAPVEQLAMSLNSVEDDQNDDNQSEDNQNNTQNDNNQQPTNEALNVTQVENSETNSANPTILSSDISNSDISSNPLSTDIDLTHLTDDMVKDGVIDLKNQEFDKLTITLQDVMNINDGKSVTITGADIDKLVFKDTVGHDGSEHTWSQISSDINTDTGMSEAIYTNSGDESLHVKVEQPISDGITC